MARPRTHLWTAGSRTRLPRRPPRPRPPAVSTSSESNRQRRFPTRRDAKLPRRPHQSLMVDSDHARAATATRKRQNHSGTNPDLLTTRHLYIKRSRELIVTLESQRNQAHSGNPKDSRISRSTESAIQIMSPNIRFDFLALLPCLRNRLIHSAIQNTHQQITVAEPHNLHQNAGINHRSTIGGGTKILSVNGDLTLET